MCHKTEVIDLSLGIKRCDWPVLVPWACDLSQDRGHWPLVVHMTQIYLSLLSGLKEREWLCIFDSAGSFFSLICHYIWCERVDNALFSAMGKFVSLRECYFTLLILSKWKISRSERGLLCVLDSQQMKDLSKWERGLLCVLDSQQMKDLSKWEKFVLHCWFLANRSFVRDMCRP